MYEWIHEEDREHFNKVIQDQQGTGEASPLLELRVRTKHSDYYDMETGINPIIDPSGIVSSLVLVMRNITERKRSERMIHHLAYHDTLTDLPNRRLFMDRLRKEIHQAKQLRLQLAIMFLDLDRFKNINDSLGREAGDLILIEASQRISQCIRSNDMVARLGGDEFIVLLTNISSPEEVASISRRIQKSLQKPIDFKGKLFHISCSMGIALFPSDGRVPKELMKRADMALYAVKDSGRNGISFFRLDMEERSLERILLENELRYLENRRFVHPGYSPE
ncbi:diguanylate cyclase domain-containing protein [Paenibacillus sp. TAB 01]|uniref:diguanylate cyclase domain-containing protein n=1 Tax=Paenibacillus sp. TAB 01 TaxID=3368988 RepID=UPI003750C5F9